MKTSLLGIDLSAKKATIVDSGDEPFSTTDLADIGKAVASILKKPEQTANKYLSEYCPHPMPLQLFQRRERPFCCPKWRLESSLCRLAYAYPQNRLTYNAVISSFTTTQNEILRVAEELAGAIFETKHITAADAEKSADDNLSSGRAYNAFWDYLRQYQFGDGAGHALKESESANALLGLQKGDLVESMKSILADV